MSNIIFNLEVIKHKYYGNIPLGKVRDTKSNIEVFTKVSDINKNTGLIKSILFDRLKTEVSYNFLERSRCDIRNINLLFLDDSAGILIHEILGHLLEIETSNISEIIDRLVFFKKNLKKIKQNFCLYDCPIYFPDTSDTNLTIHKLITNNELSSIFCTNSNFTIFNLFFSDINPIIQLRGKKQTPRTRFLKLVVEKLNPMRETTNILYIYNISKAKVEGNKVYLTIKTGLYENKLIRDITISAKITDVLSNLSWIESEYDADLLQQCIKYDDPILVGYLSPNIFIKNIDIFTLEFTKE